MPRVAGCDAVYEVANQWRQRCLVGEKSVLWPDLDETTWTPSTIEEAITVIRTLVKSKTTSGGHMEASLRDSDDAVIRVVADAVAIWYLSVGELKIGTRKGFVSYAASWSKHPPVLGLIDQALDQNVGSTEAQWFKPGLQMNRGSHLNFILDFGLRAKAQGTNLFDYQETRRLIHEVEIDNPKSQAGRNMVLHLLFPDEVEPIFNDWAKRKLLDSELARDFKTIENSDDRLAAIRERLVEKGTEANFDFYDSETRQLWSPDPLPGPEQVIHFVDDPEGFLDWAKSNPGGFVINTRRNIKANDLMLHRIDCWHFNFRKVTNLTGPFTKVCSNELQALIAWAEQEVGPEANVRYCTSCRPESSSRRYWKVSAGSDARDWDRFREGNYIAIDFDSVFDVSTLPSDNKSEFVSAYRQALPVAGNANSESHSAGQLWSFAKEMQLGDWICLYDAGHILGNGLIASEYVFIGDTPEYGHRRDVTWESQSWPVTDFSEALRQRLSQRATIVELTDFQQELLGTHGLFDLHPEPSDLHTVSAKCHIDLSELQLLNDLLHAKQQLIFEGPPGSGKTFLADLFARYLTDNPLTGDHDERIEFVQFHQSYGYEDFVQGIRPRTDPASGHLRYDVQDGVFLQMCARARENPDDVHVLIIDEINRGNLSRIFGELMMALEYRDKKVRLPYGTQDGSETTHVTIPSNLYLIGTMNSTDRSLAMIDYALRRRFYFYPLRPLIMGRATTLERWLDLQPIAREAKRQVLDWFLLLNSRISTDHGDDFQIGHSYFMSEGIERRDVQTRVWYYALLPLVREYYHGHPGLDEAIYALAPRGAVPVSLAALPVEAERDGETVAMNFDDV